MKVTRKAGKIEAMKQAAKALNGSQSKVGWFESAKYEKGQPVAGIAQVHEFGSPSRAIPPRPFFRPTASEKREEWAENARQTSRAVMRGEIQPGHVMEVVAVIAGGHVAEAITKINTPPLKQSTIKARKARLADKGKSASTKPGTAGVAGIEKPLVDTGIMLATLSYEFQGQVLPVKE